MKPLPTYASLPGNRCSLNFNEHSCEEWSAFYDVRNGIPCSCWLPRGHATQHLCVCGFCWGTGSAPTITLPDAELMHYMDKLNVLTMTLN